MIRVDDRQLRSTTTEAVAALHAANNPPEIFMRLGELVRIQADENGRHIIKELSEAGVRYHLTQAANFVHQTEKKVISVSPPRDLVQNVMSAPSWPFPALKGIVEVPVLRKSGDAIQYLRDYRRMDFKEACAYLGKEINYQSATLAGGRPAKPRWEPRVTAAPGDLWKKRAWRLVEESENWLFQPSTFAQTMLGWLKERRGLSEETIRAHRLGLVPINRFEGHGQWGLEPVFKDDGTPKKIWIPRGLTIPLCQDGKIYRIRIRRPKFALRSEADPRYYLLRGSDTRAMILGTDKPVSIIVESELDALLLHQEAGDLVNVISSGNAQTRPTQVAAEILNQSWLILVALDFDQAGAIESWGWWKEHYRQVYRWPPAAGKDPGDMLAAGVNVRKWIEFGLTEYKDVAAKPERPLHQAGAEEEPVFEENHETVPPSTPVTCESCTWYELNPWTRDPALGACCHRRMEPLAAGSPACEEFRCGEVPPRQTHERVPQVQPSTAQASPERVLTCYECHRFEANRGPNPRQGWGKCLKRRRGRFGCATACEAAITDGVLGV
jgi:DNA primase